MVNVTLIMPYSQNPHGGVETVAYNTVQGFKKVHRLLEQKDINLTIISSAGTSNPKDFSEYSNINLVNYKFPPATAFTGSLHAYKNNKEVLSNSDIIHSHDIYNAQAGIKCNKPTLLTLHGMYWKEKLVDRPTIRKEVYYSLSTISFRHLFYNLLKFIAISPYVKKELKDIGLHGMDIVFIENPISDIFFHVEKNEDNIIWYPAVISPRKNQLAMVRAMKYLLKEYPEPVTLVFTGGISDKHYLLAIRELIKKLNLSKNIKLLGKIPYFQVLSLYSTSSVVVLLSLQETAPMTISEALATGTPVVASPVGGVPYMIDHGKDGFLVNPQNPKDVAEKIRIILEDKKLKKRMGKRGKQKAMTRWRGEIVARELIDLYLKVYEGG